MAPTENSRPVHRPRAGGPKVKTGCSACKLRRVKCDETKPECLKCVKRGTKCPGFPLGRKTSGPPPRIAKKPDTPAANPGNLSLAIRTSNQGLSVIPAQSIAALSPQSQSIIALSPQSQSFVALSPQSLVSPSPSFYRPSISLPVDSVEHHYFQLFRSRTAGELSGFFDSNFWTRCVLQESHSKASIRQAVIAIGALYKTLECSRPAPSTLSTPSSSSTHSLSSDAACEHHQFALHHFGKAVTQLRESVANGERRTLRTALITQVLFVCFESFHGDHKSAINQVQSGMKLLELRDSEREDSPEDDNDLESELEQMFTRLAVQAKSYDMAFHRQMSLDVNLNAFDEYRRAHSPSMPSLFTTTIEARRCLEDVCTQTMRFTETYVPMWLMGRPLPATVQSEALAIQAAMAKWYSAFQPLFALSQTPAGQDMYVAAAVLRVYQLNAVILWEMAFSLEETGFDNFLAYFQEIVKLCREVIRLEGKGDASFSFDQAIIPPLYVTATKCRDPIVRREAIGLLCSSSRREGMWDSILVAKVSSWIMSVEEEQRDGEGAKGIPEIARVMVTKISFDLRVRKATVWCGTRYRPLDPRDPKSKMTHIEW